jgi:hypothetical protein
MPNTVEGLISKSNPSVLRHGYFLSDIIANKTLLVSLSLLVCHLYLSCPLLFNLLSAGETSDVMSTSVSGNSPVFNQNRYR